MIPGPERAQEDARRISHNAIRSVIRNVIFDN
jgi:hypothetical protein